MHSHTILQLSLTFVETISETEKLYITNFYAANDKSFQYSGGKVGVG